MQNTTQLITIYHAAFDLKHLWKPTYKWDIQTSIKNYSNCVFTISGSNEDGIFRFSNRTLDPKPVTFCNNSSYTLLKELELLFELQLNRLSKVDIFSFGIGTRVPIVEYE